MSLQRWIASPLEESAAVFPVVFLAGPRQVGKSTLMQMLLEGGSVDQYLTLDNEFERSEAQTSPEQWIATKQGRVVIDEIQRAPDLLLAIKYAVDQDRQPGRFFLTGSANPFLRPQAASALVGRMATHTLWPLSQGEFTGTRERFLDALFDVDQLADLASSVESGSEQTLARRVVHGGYPELIDQDWRYAELWLEGYVTEIVRREVTELARIERLELVPRVLALAAARTSVVINRAELARTLDVSHATLDRYMALLENVYLVQRVPAWTRNVGKRLAKAPKLLLTDTGLAATLRGLSAERLEHERDAFGQLLESFIGMELLKQIGFSATRYELFHFRSYTGVEVDYLVEDRRGQIAAVEVKLAQSLKSDHLRGLRALRELVGDSFRCGVLLYCGDEVKQIDSSIWALPVAALWQG